MSDVIIVGSGPTGLWLAYELSSAGLGVTVIEASPTRDIRSRAAAMAAGSMETLATRGIAETVLKSGLPIHSVHFGSSTVRLQMSDEVMGTKYPHSLMIPQATTEEILISLCQEKGVKFFFGHRATGLSQEGDSVTLTTENLEHETPFFTASWLLGCDGTKSTIRSLASIEFPGTDGDVTGWLADVLAEDPPTVPISANNGSGLFLIQPLGYQNYYRTAGIDVETMKLPPSARPTLEYIKSFAMAATGRDFGMHSPLWVSRYGNATRMAANFRKDHVFLAGDAAHQFFPAGGQGITTGIQDASNLAWRLVSVIKKRVTGANAEALLNGYNAERRAIVQATTKSTLAQLALYAPENSRQAALADLLFDVAANPNVNKTLARRITGFDDWFPSETEIEGQDPLIGARVTHVKVQGSFDALHAAMSVENFLLLVKNADLERALADLTKPWKEHIKYFGPNDSIETLDQRWDGVEAILIRPDARVSWVWRHDSEASELAASIIQKLRTTCREV